MAVRQYILVTQNKMFQQEHGLFQNRVTHNVYPKCSDIYDYAWHRAGLF